MQVRSLRHTTVLLSGILLLQAFCTQGQVTFGPMQNNPFGLADIGSRSNVTFADLDKDGDPDMMAGEVHGLFLYFENTGTATAPAFPSAQENPFGLVQTGIGFNSGYYLIPAFVDLDNDGDQDMMAGQFNGSFYYFENTGTDNAPAYGDQRVDTFGLANIFRYSAPTFADLDNDGDLDLMSGEAYGNFFYFENIGTVTAPAFAAEQINPFGLTQISDDGSTRPAFADLDHDGDPDMLTGARDGNFYYFENTGTSASPAFAPVQINPFGLVNIGSRGATTFADLDKDGDVDLMSGDYYGNFKYFEQLNEITCDLPTGLSTTNITSSGADLNWNAVAGASDYKIQYALAITNPSWMTVFAYPPSTSVTISGLSGATKYKWKMRSICDGERSAFTSASKFTTAAVKEHDAITDESPRLKIYPNPAGGEFMIELNSQSGASEEAEIEILNIFGEVVFTSASLFTDGQLRQQVITGEDLPPGNYFVIVTTGEKVFSSRRVIGDG